MEARGAPAFPAGVCGALIRVNCLCGTMLARPARIGRAAFDADARPVGMGARQSSKSRRPATSDVCSK